MPPAEPRRPPAPRFAVTDGPLTRGVTSHLHAANPAPGAAVRASFSKTRGGPPKFLARTLQALDIARLYRQRRYFTPLRRLRWDGRAFRRLRWHQPVPVRSAPARLPPARGDPARTRRLRRQGARRRRRPRRPLPMMMAQALSSPISFFSATRSGPPGAPRCSPPAIVPAPLCPALPRAARMRRPQRGSGGVRERGARGRRERAGMRLRERLSGPRGGRAHLLQGAGSPAARSGRCSPAYVRQHRVKRHGTQQVFSPVISRGAHRPRQSEREQTAFLFHTRGTEVISGTLRSQERGVTEGSVGETGVYTSFAR